MNTQVEPHGAHPYAEDMDPQSHTGLHPAEEHGEKKSVLKKVKAKAKKITDTLKVHVGHGHELEHGAHDHDDEEEYDDDEVDSSPEVHGAPVYDSQAAQGIVHHGHGAAPGQDRAKVDEKTACMQENKPEGYQTFNPSSVKFTPGQGEALSHSRTDTGDPAEGLLPVAPKPALEGGLGPFGSKPGEKPTHESESYQLFDPTTARTDTGTSAVKEELPYAPKNTPMMDHARPYGTGVSHTGTGLGVGGLEASGQLKEALERPKGLEKDPHGLVDKGEFRVPENYQSKVTDPTGRGGEEIGVTPILRSFDKMNIHDKQPPTTTQDESLFKPSLGQADKNFPEFPKSTGSHDQFNPEPGTFLQKPETEPQSVDSTEPSDHLQHNGQQGGYTEKVSSAAAMVADKVKQATSAVASKLGYGAHAGGATAGSGQKPPEQGGTEGGAGAAFGYHPPEQEGSYTGKLSAATTLIADKAVQAKDVAAGAGAKVAASVQKKVAPVYQKVAGGSSGAETGGGATTTPDKGVSVKEDLAEKLKPGEEDKALSDVITGALPLHKRKEGGGEEGKKVEVRGRVTESEEVERRLGPIDKRVDAGPENISPGTRVLDKLKGAATSWFGKGGETQSAQQGFHDTSKGDEGGSPGMVGGETGQSHHSCTEVGEPGLQ